MVTERPFSSPLDAFDSVERFMRPWPEVLAWPMIGLGDGTVGVLCIDEYREDGTLVVEADLPGIDPDTDLEVTAAAGVLHIAVERHDAEVPEGRRYLCHELAHRRRLERVLSLPEGVEGAAFSATYDNGVLDIRIPLPAGAGEPPVTRVPITKG